MGGRTTYLRAGALFCFACALFASSVRNGFTLDDRWILLENPLLRSLALVPRLATMDYWEPVARSGLYRPAATLSYALHHAAHGLDPLGYHVVNVLLHAVASVLAYLVLRRLLASERVALCAAFLFAAHAVHTEPVDNITGGRPELMMAVFGLMSWWLHLLQTREGRGSVVLAVSSLACFALALLSKESALTLVVVIPMADLLLRGSDTGFAATVRSLTPMQRTCYVGYAGVAMLILGIRVLMLGSLAPEEGLRDSLSNPLQELGPAWRIVSALWVALRYAGLLLAPLHLSYDYSFDEIPAIVSLTDARAWFAIAALIGLGTVVMASLRRAPEVAFALLFLLVTFSLASNVLVPIGTILGERLLYLPSLGFCVALAITIHTLVGAIAGRASLQRRAAALLFVALTALPVGLHAARSLIRHEDWRDNATLWLHDLASAPGSAKVQSNAGWALLDRGRPREALGHFERAVAIVPEPARYVTPHKGIVYALVALGRFGEARQAYGPVRRFEGTDPVLERAIAEGLAP
jgi:hypothetical protein